MLAALPSYASDPDTPTVSARVESQFRMVADRPAQEAERSEAGFLIRRARFDVRAARQDDRLSGRLRLACGCSNKTAAVDLCYVDMKSAGNWSLRLGQFKPRFLHEELVASARQICAERSYAADYLTVDITQGAALTWRRNRWRCDAAWHDGAYAAATDFDADGRDLAACARVSWATIGEGAQIESYRPVAGRSPALQLGLAADHESGPAEPADRFTVDGNLVAGRVNAFFSAARQHLDAGADAAEARQTVLVCQAAAAVAERWDGFLRWEHLDLDGRYHRAARGGAQSGSGAVADDRITIWTAGVNFYRHGQSDRWTLDVIHTEDPIPVADTGAGLRQVADGGQTAVRLQYQVIFR